MIGTLFTEKMNMVLIGLHFLFALFCSPAHLSPRLKKKTPPLHLVPQNICIKGYGKDVWLIINGNGSIKETI